MCLTIPKKVLSADGNSVTVELADGTRQVVKSIVELNAGDYCLTQQNVAVQKISRKDAEEVLTIINNLGGNRI